MMNNELNQENRMMGHLVGQQFTDEELDAIAGGNEPVCGSRSTSIPCGAGWGAGCKGCMAD